MNVALKTALKVFSFLHFFFNFYVVDAYSVSMPLWSGGYTDTLLRRIRGGRQGSKMIYADLENIAILLWFQLYTIVFCLVKTKLGIRVMR